jgi:hypothetical protein
MRCSKIK